MATMRLAAQPQSESAAPTYEVHATQAQTVQIKAAWIRWLPGGVPLAGYATLANASDQPIVLTSATSAVFNDLSFHQSIRTAGTVRMSPLERLAVGPRSTVDFESRGIHLMLMQPREPLDPRGQVPITLHFADGSSVTTHFEVRASANAASSG